MTNYNNRQIVFTTVNSESAIEISSDIGGAFDEAIRRLDTLDYSSIRGNPFDQYFEYDSQGSRLSGLHIANIWSYGNIKAGVPAEITFQDKIDQLRESGQSIPGGFNLSLGLGQTVFSTSDNWPEMNPSLHRGIDTIFINPWYDSGRKEGQLKEPDYIIGAIVHELLHESALVQADAEKMVEMYRQQANAGADVDWGDVFNAAEHVVLQKMMLEFATDNGLKEYTRGSLSINAYEETLARTLNGSGLSRSEINGVSAQFSLEPELGVKPISYNENGSLEFYRNE